MGDAVTVLSIRLSRVELGIVRAAANSTGHTLASFVRWRIRERLGVEGSPRGVSPVKVTLAPGEFEALETFARREGLTLSEAVRQCLALPYLPPFG